MRILLASLAIISCGPPARPLGPERDLDLQTIARDGGASDADAAAPPAVAADVVTVEAYRACVTAARCELPDVEGPDCTWDQPGRDRSPMTCLDVERAAAYCAFTGARLASEPEELAAGRGFRCAR